MNRCLFIQPAGLGDLIFLLKAYDYIKSNYQITWPILPNLMYIKDYLDNDINFVPVSNHIRTTEYDIVIPFQTADQYFPNESVLKSKYKLIDFSWDNWQNYFLLKRNYQKEEELFNKLCPKNQPYTVICKMVGTPPGHRTQEVYYEKNDNVVVEITLLEGDTPFGYCKIFEQADQIATVETCWQYIIEKLDLKTDKLFLTSRFTPPNWVHVAGLFQKPWVYLD